jgi:hypothetical protein
MTYTYTKKVETVETVTTRPSDIYNMPGAKQNIDKLLASGYEIIDFRKPTDVDQFISAQWGGSVMGPNKAWVAGDEPRLIVKPIITLVDKYWE